MHMTPTYTYIYLQQTQRGDCLGYISGWISNTDLGLMETQKIIIVGTSRQCNKLTNFFPTSILNHIITPYHTVRNIGSTFDSDVNIRKYIYLACRCCFYYIRDLSCVHRYICLLVAKLLATAFKPSRLDY